MWANACVWDAEQVRQPSGHLDAPDNATEAGKRHSSHSQEQEEETPAEGLPAASRKGAGGAAQLTPPAFGEPNMNQSSTNPAAQTEHNDASFAERMAKAKAAFLAKKARDEAHPQLHLIGELGVAFEMARRCIAELLELAGADDAPVDSLLANDPEAMTWSELSRHLEGWDYFASQAFNVLDWEFASSESTATPSCRRCRRARSPTGCRDTPHYPGPAPPPRGCRAVVIHPWR
jgi:hypothetical protein